MQGYILESWKFTIFLSMIVFLLMNCLRNLHFLSVWFHWIRQ